MHRNAVPAAETRLASRLPESVRSDRLLSATLGAAVGHARSGRRRLDALHAELLEAAVAHRAPARDTPTGARHFQRFLAATARDIHRVVSAAVADDRALTVRLRSVGSGYGIPARERDRINRRTLADDIDRVTGARTAVGAAEMARYHNALQVRDGLAAASGAGPVLLLGYDPEAFDGRGRAVIAIGDPDVADNTTVLVPGAGSSVRDGYLSHPDALHLYREAVDADPGRTDSVIVWMGYRAPDGLLDPAVMRPAAARAGARLLAADVNTLAGTHRGRSHLTVIGHSYGSTTVADAAAGFGMAVDDVVLVGSPGTDLARDATAFHLPAGGHVYVGAASSDPITGLAGDPQLRIPGGSTTIGLGGDPAADGYGSTRFKAELPGIAAPFTGHNSYFDPGGESLFSIGDIASGHGDALAEHHMTALHRRRLPAFDPERLRPGTGAHRH